MIVFPMAGLSRRFAEAGYTKPKYMLPLDGGTCFDYSVLGFRQAYADQTFVFIMRNVFETPSFVAERVKALGLKRYRLVVLDTPTSGQGETVEKGLAAEGLEDEELTIFNIDTFRIGVTSTTPEQRGEGFLEVFTGSGTNWSFVAPAAGEGSRVARTTEKDPVSDLCCTGLYNFAHPRLFLDALDAERHAPTSGLAETYVAPVYNHLIQQGRDIRYRHIAREDVVFCGVPAEYEALLLDPSPLRQLRSLA